MTFADRMPAVEEVVIHGHRVSFRRAGTGSALVLIHGITGSSRTWEDVIPPLAERHTVIAPDLLGHGESAKPRGDYSLGAYASGVRDLLIALGIDKATVVGHSLGGGVAMQFAYQFPERVERLVLVSSGGLGEEVHLLLRAATLPAAEYVLPLLCAEPLRNAGASVARLLGRAGLRPEPRPRGDGARLRVARRHGGAAGVRAHRPRDHGHQRPARLGARPPLPGRGGADPADLGRARPDDPGLPRPRGARGDARQPLHRLRGRGPLPASATTRGASRSDLLDFVDATSPAVVDEDEVRALMQRGG